MFHHDVEPRITVDGHTYTIFDGPIQPQWQEIAEKKGFVVRGCGRDCYHLILRHVECGRDMLCKIFTLRTCLPTCPHCLDDRRRELCDGAGVTLLGRYERPHYSLIRQPCGHQTTRQQELLERASAGQTDIR